MNRELKRREKAEADCKHWNRLHPVGDACKVTLDNGAVRDTTTRSEAYVSASGHAVIFLTGISGYYLLDRVNAVPVMR